MHQAWHLLSLPARCAPRCVFSLLFSLSLALQVLKTRSRPVAASAVLTSFWTSAAPCVCGISSDDRLLPRELYPFAKWSQLEAPFAKKAVKVTRGRKQVWAPDGGRCVAEGKRASDSQRFIRPHQSVTVSRHCHSLQPRADSGGQQRGCTTVSALQRRLPSRWATQGYPTVNGGQNHRRENFKEESPG